MALALFFNPTWRMASRARTHHGSEEHSHPDHVRCEGQRLYCSPRSTESTDPPRDSTASRRSRPEARRLWVGEFIARSLNVLEQPTKLYLSTHFFVKCPEKTTPLLVALFLHILIQGSSCGIVLYHAMVLRKISWESMDGYCFHRS